MTEGRRYQLSSRDQTGIFLGLGMGEIVVVGAGFAATLVLRLLGLSVAVAALPLVGAAAAAKLCVGGRPLYRWLPLAQSWMVARAVGRHRWRTVLPLLPSDRQQVALPPVLAGLDIVHVPARGGDIAVVRDGRTARLTAVLPAGGREFVGAEAQVQDGILASWGDLLLAAGSHAQVGWSHQARPTGLYPHRSWVHDTRDNPPPDGYYDLVDDVAGLATAHETVVWVTVSGRDIAGKGKLLDRAAERLPIAVEAVADALASSGVQVDAPMAAVELWRLLRWRSDADPTIDEHPSFSLAHRLGLTGAEGGPLAMDTSWGEVHIDGSWHRTYWIEAWPRRPVSADWLAGFLGAAEATTTVAFRLVDPGRSQRRVESQLVKHAAHRARKDEKARRITEEEERAEQAIHDLEAELASGYSEVLYLGLVSVAARSRSELDDRCRTVEQLARGAQLGLRVLHGRQDAAWAATLPFGLLAPGLTDMAGL